MIQAINDIVIIERDGYQGVLIAPYEKMCHGTVLSVGPGAWSASIWDIDPITRTVQEKWRPTSLKPGQRVCFSLDKGEEHIIEGKHVVVMRESHVAGVLEDGPISLNEIAESHFDDIFKPAGQKLVNALINELKCPNLDPESLNGKGGNLDMEYQMVSAQDGY